MLAIYNSKKNHYLEEKRRPTNSNLSIFLAQMFHGKIMGVIEKGTLSGELPNNESFAAHYPG